MESKLGGELEKRSIIVIINIQIRIIKLNFAL